ncbi:sulfur carrier protein ThiS adenylyltransferase ThiF [Acidaminobacter sp. JC074]|uniref:sulfur carrier protein ThiS adenylyltransferase ThiF n=1 Tax=Acidaminobacter sp. JC074 TaxID=2530199 RepID=UPI001F0CF236|nr:sulfur carrier protein ThiS adenylyltransferase ThiF [Acidaminobacter sp. JC074]MCH4889437.1 sulfur carrier protein ThiS adenylyltransferase ThiF [Acidaminobacter sp. JC074]
MKIYVNEKAVEINKTSLFEIKEAYYPQADIMIYNGFPVKEDLELKEGDHLFFITRGVLPSKESFEEALVSRHTPGVHEKVKSSRVAIAGLGGLGSNIAIMLARIGVGYLKLIDFDVVEPSNLNRQQYFIHHLGMKKTEAIEMILKDVNPFIEVEVVDCYVKAENVKSLFKDVDIVVEAFDGAENKAMLINEVLSSFPDKYMVAASGLAGYFSNNTIVTKRITDKFYLVGDDVSEAKPGSGLMAPRASLAASHQANTVLRIIMEAYEV